jgi:hypothetical protein
MESSARSPEELVALLEDAFVLRDAAALVGLFAPRAMLVAAGRHPAHGRPEIAAAVSALWADDRTYLAGPYRVLSAGDTALAFCTDAVHVMQRSRARTWRYAISVLGGSAG